MRRNIFRLSLIVLALDVGVVAYFWVPAMMGYVGSEGHEWSAIPVGVFGAILALVCGIVALATWGQALSN